MRKKWGSYRVVARGDRWKLKELVLNPHSATSMQKHLFRNEVWIVPDYPARLVKVGEWHKLENTTDKTVRVIEFQFGDKCLENDIIRKK